MPLCPQCKADAEVQQRGPSTPTWVRWISSLLTRDREVSDDASGQCDECSRCSKEVDQQ